MKKKLYAGTTSHIERVFLQDSSQTDGRGLTGLAYNSSGLTVYYIREGDATPTQITLVTATVGTWVSGGFVEIDATNMPGWYELHLPNAAIAAGAKSVGIHLKGATNMAPYPIELELDAVNYQDATRLGLSALPNANAGAVGGLGLLDATGNLPADVKRWLAAVPAGLSATGLIQVMLLRWLTDNAAGTPSALQAGRLDVYLGTYAEGKAPLQPTVDGRKLAVDANGDVAANNMRGTDGALLANNYTVPPTVQEIDTQLAGSHGAGAWGPGDAAGAYSVTVTAVDDVTEAPLAEVLVTLRTAAGNLSDQARTDADGERVFPMNDGDYLLSAGPIPGYGSVAGQAFTVAGASRPVEVRLSPIAVSAPAGSNFCTLYVDVFEDEATPSEGVTFSATSVSLPHLLTSAILSGEERSGTTNASGRAELQLARGKKYRVRLAREGINQVITIPDTASANLRSLL